MAKDVLIVIGLLVLGVLVFCLCCYKVTNLLYQLFSLDSQPPDFEFSPIQDKPLPSYSGVPRSVSFSQAPPGHRLEGSREELLCTPDSHRHTKSPEYRQGSNPDLRPHSNHSYARYTTYPSQENLVDRRGSSEYQVKTTPRCSRHAQLRFSETRKSSARSQEELPMMKINHFSSIEKIRLNDASMRTPPPYSHPPQIQTYRCNGRIGGDSSALYQSKLSGSYSNVHSIREHNVVSSDQEYPRPLHKSNFEMHSCQEREGERYSSGVHSSHTSVQGGGHSTHNSAGVHLSHGSIHGPHSSSQQGSIHGPHSSSQQGSQGNNNSSAPGGGVHSNSVGRNHEPVSTGPSGGHAGGHPAGHATGQPYSIPQRRTSSPYKSSRGNVSSAFHKHSQHSTNVKRTTSSHSLEDDKEVSAMFHRDTLLARV